MTTSSQTIRSTIVIRITIAFLLLGVTYSQVNGQALTGVKTIPGTYSSLVAAVADLNTNGVGVGGVTFNIAAGYTETLTTRLAVTATGTAANPILFQKSGVGANPLITAYTGSRLASSSDSVDVMWAFEGSDYVTINGINLTESSLNTTPTTMMEVGYGFYKVDGTNGANNNTVQNCTVTLNRDNITAISSGPRANAAGSVAIELVNATRINAGTAITVTAVSGASSNNKFYGNTIQNCNFGILLSGFAAPSPYTLADVGNDIGGNSVSTGNTIINFGGGVGATVACGAILINNQWSFNISYNTVNNNNGSGVNHTTTNRGIWLFNSSVGASAEINYNKITIDASSSAVGSNNWCLDLEMATSGANGNIINVNNNQFLNCKNTAASTAFFTAIWLNTAATTVNTNNNYFYGFTYAGTSTSQVILSQLACGTLNILNNVIDSTVLSGTAASGTHYNIGVTIAPTVAVNVNGNTVTRTIMNTAGVGSKTLYGIYYTGATPVTNMNDNVVNDITRNGTTGGVTIGIYQAGGTNGTSTTTVKRNTVSNLTISGTGATSTMYGIQVSTGTIICDSNTIFNLSNTKSSGTSAIYGIYDISSPNNESYSYNRIYNISTAGTGANYGIFTNTAVGVRTIAFNTIYNLSGAGAVSGLNQTNSVPSIFSNKIYDITTSSTTALAAGISLTTSAAGTLRIFNNLISGITAPVSNGGATASTVRGISFTTTSATTTLGVYNNTILLSGTSSGAAFSSAGIFHTYSATATSASLDMRNNIIVNNIIPTGAGRAVALWRSAATDLNNFNTLSNRNILYAGTPGANNLIYFDGTNADQTLAAYKTRVAPRDSASFSELPTFLSTVGASSLFLNLNPAIATNAEATGRNIAGISTDFSGNIRAGNVGYVGLSGAPDIGAVEGDYLGLVANQMYFDSANADQISGTIPRGSSNNLIARVRVYVDKGYNAMVASSFKLTLSSTTLPADVTGARIYYTGSDPNFSTNQLFGSTSTITPSYSIAGSRRLTLGVNYFWIAYDISPTATPGNVADVAIDSIVLNGTNVALINGDPAGNRQIASRLNGNYNVGISQPYTSLTAAVNDLTALGVTGPVTFTLMDAQYDSLTTGEIFPITLNSYVGASATNTVTIRPSTSVASRIVTVGSNPVFRFNGGSNYIIDGRQGGIGGFVSGNNLIIENTNLNGNTISFVNDADSNRVVYTDVRGSNTIAAGSAGAGVINFGTTTGTNGNDFNTIRYCDIHEGITGFPAVAISSIGTGTTVVSNNDLNTIDSNNIYNYYSATVATAAVYVGANNSSWRINNNKFYQTSPRVHTASVTHRVLWITPNTANLTSASGFVINNNYIGGDNPSGTGVYDMRGSAATYTFNVMDLSVGLGAATVVQNNIITNISDSTSQTSAIAFGGINVVNGNINVLNNLIGSRTTNGAISFYAASTTSGGAMGIRTGGGTNNTFNISGNIISGFDLYGTTATTAPEFFGINIFTGTNVNAFNNMIGDTTLTNSIRIVSTSLSSASLQRVTGIFNNPSATAVHSIYNNIIANITNNYAGASASHSLTKGIVVAPTATGTFTVTGNTIKNISTASQSVGTGFNATLVGIGVNYTAGTFNVTGNTISDLTLTGVSVTAPVQNTGIFYSVPTTGINVLSRNFIHSQSQTAINPFAVLTGIDLAGGNGIVSNNMIRMGIDGTGTGITTACTIRGITKNSGNASVYFNTVYVGGAGVGSDFNRTYAFQRTGAGTDDVQNNIFYNVRSNASFGGGHFAIGLNNNTTLNQNYNLLKADSIGLYNNISLHEITDWKVASGEDPASISSSLVFRNAGGNTLTLNLRIDSTIATPIEAYGTPVAGTGTDVDFDGLLRSTLTPVDLGADAGNFTPSDIAPPVINFTNLGNTLSTTDRTFTAAITDATGVYITGANRPRVYFKKMAVGTWFSNPGTLTAGSATNGTWQFTISSATMGGLLGDDSVYYYVVAQDSTLFNNLGSSPGGVEGTSVTIISVTPNPISYKITPTVNGIFDVGAGQTYTTLTGPTGLFNYLNAVVLNGNVTVRIVSDIEEPGTVGLNELAETGAGGYRVRIEPSGATVRNITGTYAGSGLIRLSGADRVRIDGNFGGSGRYLRFMNRSLTGSTLNLLEDADNDTIANCIIEGVNNTVGMMNFQSSTKVGGTGNDSNAVIGCLFRDTLGNTAPTGMPNTALFSQGALSNDYNTFDNNELYNFGYNGVNLSTTSGNFWTLSNNKIYQQLNRNVGMTIFQIDGGSGHLITGNSIGGAAVDRSGPAMTSTAASDIIRIQTTVTTTNPIVISNNTISNIGSTTVVFQPILVAGGVVTVSNNTIGGGANPQDTFTCNGTSSAIHFSGGAGTSIVIDNNLVSNVRFLNASTLRNGGISATTTTSGAITISNNIVRNVFGLNTGISTATARLGGILVTSSPTSGLVISGNTVSNIQSINTGTAAYAPVGIMVGSTGATYSIVRNRVSNIISLGTGTGASAPVIHGIQISSTANNCIIANNQVTLGSSAVGESIVYGISDFSSGANTFAYNSVFINGTTAAGANHSYSFFRNASTSTVNLRNNILYNKRTTLGTGNNYAVGSASATGISGANINYNLMIVNDTSRIAELPSGTANGWTALNSLYTTTFNTNWATTSISVPADSLFIDTLIGNLGIVTTNTHSWFANGKGIAISGLSGDYNSASGARSVSTSSGATDIGSVEFNPTTLPPFAFADKAPVANDSTQFFVAGRLVAKAKWSTSGSLPSSIDLRYFSGVNPPNTGSGKTVTNAYWNFQPAGGSGYTYDLTLMSDSAAFGTVSNGANWDIANYSGSGVLWTNYTNSTFDAVRGMVTSAGVTVPLGRFAGTDGSNSPLPVKLTAFEGVVSNGDVVLTWTSVSESNNRGFEVQRSVDGKTFDFAGFVKGAGNSNRELNYSLVDRGAFEKVDASTLYYRLKQVDINGEVSYSKTVVVSMNAESVNGLSVFPNPFNAYYTVSFNAASGGVAKVEMVDIQGKLVNEQLATVTKGYNLVAVEELISLQTGIYFVKVTVNGEMKVLKLIKN